MYISASFPLRILAPVRRSPHLFARAAHAATLRLLLGLQLCIVARKRPRPRHARAAPYDPGRALRGHVRVRRLTSSVHPSNSASLSCSDRSTDTARVRGQDAPELRDTLFVHACSISTTTATAYDTPELPGLTRSLSDPECAALVTNADLLPTVLAVLPNTPSVNGKGLLEEE
ncbi:hypothetical protein C8R43DRAFT_1122104 [Mycena crocata]|nr:hypothetical protein C8R43DRAFT_1122104 [Mycena crocata]